MLNHKFHKIGLLAMALPLVLVMTVVGFEKDTTNDTKTISPELSGKWEVSKILVDGTEHSLPYSGINTGGYLFSSGSLASYINGNISFDARGVYTENNRVYSLDGQAGYFFRITGNTLTILIDGSSSIIAAKVSRFSWE